MARADLYTQTQKKQEYFSDFLTSFDKHPISDDTARVTNENAVSQSIKNLVLTNYGERLYNSEIGSNVYKSLFEPYSQFTADDIIRHISDTIKAKETRRENARRLSDSISGLSPKQRYEYEVKIEKEKDKKEEEKEKKEMQEYIKEAQRLKKLNQLNANK